MAELDAIGLLPETDDTVPADQDVPADQSSRVVKHVLSVPMTDEGFEYGGPGPLTRQVHEFRAGEFVRCGNVGD